MAVTERYKPERCDKKPLRLNLRLACVFSQFCHIVIIYYERVCGNRKVYGRKKSTHEKGIYILCTSHLYARPLWTGDTRDIAGLKCWQLTYDVARSAMDVLGGGVISRLNRIATWRFCWSIRMFSGRGGSQKYPIGV